VLFGPCGYEISGEGEEAELEEMKRGGGFGGLREGRVRCRDGFGDGEVTARRAERAEVTVACEKDELVRRSTAAAEEEGGKVAALQCARSRVRSEWERK